MIDICRQMNRDQQVKYGAIYSMAHTIPCILQKIFH